MSDKTFQEYTGKIFGEEKVEKYNEVKEKLAEQFSKSEDVERSQDSDNDLMDGDAAPEKPLEKNPVANPFRSGPDAQVYDVIDQRIREELSLQEALKSQRATIKKPIRDVDDEIRELRLKYMKEREALIEKRNEMNKQCAETAEPINKKMKESKDRLQKLTTAKKALAGELKKPAKPKAKPEVKPVSSSTPMPKDKTKSKGKPKPKQKPDDPTKNNVTPKSGLEGGSSRRSPSRDAMRRERSSSRGYNTSAGERSLPASSISTRLGQREGGYRDRPHPYASSRPSGFRTGYHPGHNNGYNPGFNTGNRSSRPTGWRRYPLSGDPNFPANDIRYRESNPSNSMPAPRESEQERQARREGIWRPGKNYK